MNPAGQLAPDKSAESPREQRNTHLDGIRGLAILLVIICHSFGDVRSGSLLTAAIVSLADFCWIGVDLFFVLSGYLITGILLRTRGQPGYFRTFYMRRFLRIFPLYYAFIGVLFALALLKPVLRKEIPFAWLVLYGVNFEVALRGWPWHSVQHFWSLSVEEQFYLVWPAFIAILPRRKTVTVIGIAIAGFIVLRQVTDYLAMRSGYDLVAYFLLHIDGLMLGAMLAAYHREKPASDGMRRAGLFTLAAMGILVAAGSVRGKALNWRDWHGAACLNYSLVAIAAAALIAVSVYSPGGARINRGLSARPLVMLGKYSYALYIFHYPLDTIFRRLGLHSFSIGWALPYAAMLTASSLAVAWVSWRVIEEPCIRLKDQFFSYKNKARAAAA